MKTIDKTSTFQILRNILGNTCYKVVKDYTIFNIFTLSTNYVLNNKYAYKYKNSSIYYFSIK